MDYTEKHVLEHLKHIGFTNIIYEPDGNIPPDFLVDNKIAIEVRRLNQNYFDGNTTKGLEEAAIPLSYNIKKLLLDIGTPINGQSWFVWFHFSRPVEIWSALKRKIKNTLIDFIQSSNQHNVSNILINETNFQLKVYIASKAYPTTFLLGGCSDEQSGGWVIPEMKTNIQHCIHDKTGKISRFRTKYPKWWLALVDHVGFGLDEFDRNQFHGQVSIIHNWDKIIIINPNDYKNYFEI